MNKKELSDRKKILENSQYILNSKVLLEYPIKYILTDLSHCQKYYRYSYLPTGTLIFLDKIKQNYSNEIFSSYLEIVALNLAYNSYDLMELLDFPEYIKEIYPSWIKRIFEVDSFKKITQNFNNDLLLKYLSICSLRSVPVGGAWFVELAGISKKILFQGGISQFFKCMFFATASMSAWKPFYQLHMVQNMVDLVNPEGREACYLGIAELLKKNKDVKGMFAGSWYYDPVIKKISPRLSYLSNTALNNGAKVFRVGSSLADIDNATKTSPTRRQLYTNGDYVPTTFLLIWARKDLIAWSNQ